MKPALDSLIAFIFTSMTILTAANADDKPTDTYDFGGSRHSKLDNESGNLNTLLARYAVNKTCRSAVDKARKNALGASIGETKSPPEGENFGRLFTSQKPFMAIHSKVKVDDKTGEVIVTTFKIKYSGKSFDDETLFGPPAIKKLNASDFSQEELKCLKSPEMDTLKGCSWEGSPPKASNGQCHGNVRCQPSFAGAGNEPLNMHVNSVSCYTRIETGGCLTGSQLDTCVRDVLRNESNIQFSRDPILGIEALRRRTNNIENTVR